MRFIVIPESPEVWIAVGVILLLAIGFALYRGIWPSRAEKACADDRYREALGVFRANLPQEIEPKREDRRKAFAVAVAFLATEHSVPGEEAGANLRLVVAQSDRELSYDLRHDALAYEQAGAHQLALDLFERAARLQEEHDAKDYQFLQRCFARVRKKVRAG